MSSTFVEKSLGLLKACKFIGLIPMNVIWTRKSSKISQDQDPDTLIFDRLEIDKGWKSLLPKFVVQFYQLFGIFYIICRLIKYGQTSKNSVSFLHTCLIFGPFLTYYVLATAVFQYCRTKTVQVLQFINNWNRFEKDLRNQINWFCIMDLEALDTVSTNFFRLIRFRLFSIIFVILPQFFTLIVPKFKQLLANKYFLALVGGDLIEDSNPWLGWITSATIFGVMGISFYILAGFALIAEGFPKVTAAYLKVLNSGKQLFPLTALRLYDQILKLMKSYNSLFGQMLFAEQCVTFLVICTTEFCCLRLPFSLAIYYLVFSVIMGFRQVALLRAMGISHNEAINWKSNQIKALCSSDSKYKSFQFIIASIQGREPIQFVFGGFYGVTSTTILTFFQIVSTHLIVLLQIPLPNLD